MSLAQVSSLDSARGSTLKSAEGSIASNTSSKSATTSSTSSSTSSGGAELKNEFLQMMVAQINNQDPLNPLDGTEYVSQLAQFSMVEGVENLRVLQQKSLTMQDTEQVLQSTALVGKEVMAPANTLKLEQPQDVRGQIYLPGAADGVTLRVYDQYGQKVATRQWSSSGQGALNYELADLPAGQYSFEVTATQGGVQSKPQNYVAGEVERVVLPGTGEIQLQVEGVGTVSLFNVVEFGKTVA